MNRRRRRYDDRDFDDVIEDVDDFCDMVGTVSDFFFPGEEVKPIDANEHRNSLLSSGGWQCRCGAVNASYVGTCSCGCTKDENEGW